MGSQLEFVVFQHIITFSPALDNFNALVVSGFCQLSTLMFQADGFHPAYSRCVVLPTHELPMSFCRTLHAH